MRAAATGGGQLLVKYDDPTQIVPTKPPALAKAPVSTPVTHTTGRAGVVGAKTGAVVWDTSLARIPKTKKQGLLLSNVWLKPWQLVIWPWRFEMLAILGSDRKNWTGGLLG